MSRIIIKNLPSKTDEAGLRKRFSVKGTITDCALKYTPDGKFRKFAFIGYKTPQEAQAAQQYFHQSYINTSKLQVEIAKDFGDDKKPRSWSKYSRDSSAYQRMKQKLDENKEDAKDQSISKAKNKKNKLKAREEKLGEMLGELKDDDKFNEFLNIHQNKTSKESWSNDAIINEKAMAEDDTDKEEDISVKAETDEESGEDDSLQAAEKGNENDSQNSTTKEEKLSQTDIDYLKYLKKMSSNSNLMDSSEEDSDQEEIKKAKKKGKKKVYNARRDDATSSSDDEESDENSGNSKIEAQEKKDKNKSKSSSRKTSDSESSSTSGSEDDVSSCKDSSDESSNGESSSEEDESSNKSKEKKNNLLNNNERTGFVIKMKGLPPTTKEKQIHQFFKPLKIREIKIPKNAKGTKTFSIATVEFYSDKDTELGMKKNKDFIGEKKVFLYKVKQDIQPAQKEEVWVEAKNPKKPDDNVESIEDETIAESGRLFMRNLAYVCTEDDIEALFSKYGPLTEVIVPIDKISKKIKGYAIVTFMMPEHAVKAFTELDGTVFQGRMLHIIPGKAKKEEELPDDATFKQKKAAKQKKLAESSHNWNALFIGANAVADVMAAKYNISKGDILSSESKQSLGVRMALGETQIVAETKQFLIDNGVSLDCFGQASVQRSKIVILVKNLPANTTTDELKEKFEKFGTIGRLILPPSGVTAIVEFTEPSEARAAFKNLAYTKFKYSPLYLEWAPSDVFSPTPQEEEPQAGTSASTESKETESLSSDDDEESKPDCTLFVKNLNFSTSEDALRTFFKSIGKIRAVSIAKKKDPKKPGELLSMGYGFVEYAKPSLVNEAMKKLQHATLDGHKLELKKSNRTTVRAAGPRKKQDSKKKQTSSKILVRNIPFEAKESEIRELFNTFGELKTVRLPKKLSETTGSHRGFAFIDFLTKQDAKRAFYALCTSTRLYGRRLVLEWANTNDDDVEELRKRTAEHFHDDVPSKRLKKSNLMEDLRLGTSSGSQEQDME